MSLRSRFRHLALILSDSRWWKFYVQRRVLSPSSREYWADKLSSQRPQWIAASSDNAELTKRELEGSGIAMLGKVLDKQQCHDVLNYLGTCEVADPYRPEAGHFLPDSNKRPSHSHVLYHKDQDVLTAPHLLELANSPAILDAAASFLGCKPTLDYLAAWWSYPTGIAAQHAEKFHRDIDDFRFLKLFVYLTDVGLDNGPHAYVTYSASHHEHRRPIRLSDEDVQRAFGIANVRVITGQSGDAFLENTQGVHKGYPVKEGRRAIFQAVYSVLGTPYGPKKPVLSINAIQEPLRSQIDPWVNRIYLSTNSQ